MTLSTTSHQSIKTLSNHEAELFFKFFFEIDQCVSSRFTFGNTPNEEHLTDILCELLDTTGNKHHTSEYSLSQLNEDLSKRGGLVRSTIDIKTNTYDRTYEGSVVHADLGILLNYTDSVYPENSFQKGILLQAKKIFPYPVRTNQYTLQSKYKSFKAEQLRSIIELNERYSQPPYDCIQYLLYNPTLSFFQNTDRVESISQQIEEFGAKIFSNDYLQIIPTSGKDENKIDIIRKSLTQLASLVISAQDVEKIAMEAGHSQNPTIFSFKNVIDNRPLYINSLPWFLVYHFFLGNHGCTCPEFTNKLQNLQTSELQNVDFLPPRYLVIINVFYGDINDERENR